MANLWLLHFCRAITILSQQDLLDFAAEAQNQLCAGLSQRGGVALLYSQIAQRVVDRWEGKRRGERAPTDTESQLKGASEFVAKLKNETKESPFLSIN